MHSFTDNAGRTWTVDITVADIKRLRAMLGVDFVNLTRADAPPEEQLLARLATDPVLLVDVLYVLCLDQAQKADITDEQFGRAMAGDAIEEATEALLQAIVDFTPNPRERARLARGKTALYETRAMLDDLYDERLEKRIAEEISGASSTSSPPSQE